MGLKSLSLKDAGNDFLGRLRNPYDKYKQGPPDQKSANERNDFKEGFLIVEIVNGRERTKDSVRLLGDAMPHQPFNYGGTQKLVKDYYPGNSEPSIQVLGPREKDIPIKGRFKSKRIKTPVNATKEQIEEFRGYALEIQQQIEAIRLRGNLLRIEMGEFQRYGFMESADFKLKTVAEIAYEINFSIIGFNPPQNCRVIGKTRQVPFDINKELIAQVAAFQEFQGQTPGNFDRSLATQLNDAISEVATAANLVTGFVDTVLNEVDTIRNSVARALGLIKNARNQLVQFGNRVGAIESFGGAPFAVADGVGIADAYINANFLADIKTQAFGLTSFMERLREQISEIAATEPEARHQVVSGDTLQFLASKFYGDATNWKNIYDHNQLQDTDLELIRGEIIEIPKVS